MDRHPVRMLPLLAGLAFLAFGLGALADAEGGDGAAWLAPLALVAVGAAVMAGALAHRRDEG